MLPTIDNNLFRFDPINKVIGQQMIAREGNINHGKLPPVEILTNAKNNIVIRLPASEKPIE